MKFEELNLPEFILEGLKSQDITLATDIQAKCIPAIREGRDVVGTSQTGSGKTYAFGIPAIEMIDPAPYVQSLIVCPTRELASQVCDELRKLTSLKEGTRVVPVFGGSSIERQIMALKKGARIVVGTPGRLMDHIRRRTLKLAHLKLLVLDEADEMLDMGFREDIEEILKVTNSERQTVMFSATMPKPILEITKNYMKDPVSIESDTQGQAQSFIEQYYMSVDRKEKNEALVLLLRNMPSERSIIFCNTKSMVDELTSYLNESNIAAIGIHGDMRQNERRNSMTAIKRNDARVLVATDVAARGIDIKDVEMIVNYDVPNCSEYYVHRIGRTARAGKTGVAYTIVCGKGQLAALNDIKRETKNDVEEYVCDLSVKLTAKPAKSDGIRKDVFKKGKNFVTAKKKWDDKPRTDAPKRDWTAEKPKRVWDDKPRTDKPKSDWTAEKPKRVWDDKPRTDAPKRDWTAEKPKRVWDDKPRTDAPKRDWTAEKPKRVWDDKPRTDAPKRDWKSDKPRTDAPKRDWKSDKPRTDAPKRDWKSDKPRGDKPKSDWTAEKPKRVWDDKPRTDAPKRVWDDKPKSDRPRSDKPKADFAKNANVGFEKPKKKWHK